MSESVHTPRLAVVIDLAEYRAAHRRDAAPRTLPEIRRRAPLRLPAPQDIAHRQRMLEHLERSNSETRARM